MLQNRATIKFRLYASAAGIFLILIVIGIISYYNVKKASQRQATFSHLNLLSYRNQQLYNTEKDFLVYEPSNIDFFRTGKSQYIDEFNSQISEIQEIISYLLSNPYIKNYALTDNIEDLTQQFNNRRKQFANLTELVQQKGFKDFGLIGEMRSQIHFVENQLENIDDNDKLTANMLMLRRHEKDFLLRNDLKYREKFNQKVQRFIEEIEQSASLTDNTKRLLINSLQQYKLLFGKVIEKDLLIGNSQNQGMAYQLNQTQKTIENNMRLIRQHFKEQSDSGLRYALIALFIIFFLLVAVIVLILLRTSNYIINSIFYLQKPIVLLGKGKVPKKLNPKKRDEIAKIAVSINSLIDSIKNTAGFAHQIAGGNIDARYESIGKNDVVGKALIEMQKSLKKAKEEEIKQYKEETERNKITQGLAHLNDILRNETNDLEKYGHNINNFLIKYIEAEQGALYIVNDQDEEDVHIQMISCIAYDFKRQQKKRIEPGDGLIGRCINEKQTIYMTDVPDGYTEITSGLGDRTPSDILIVPLKHNDYVFGAVELASLATISPLNIKFIEEAAESIAASISTVKTNIRTSELLEISEAHSKRMMEQEEIMRQNIEEMQTMQENMSQKEKKLKDEINRLKKENKEI